MKKQVLIADADKDFCNDLIRSLDSDEFEVVGIASDGEEAFEKITNRLCGLLVIDLMLPKCDGLTLLERLRKETPRYRPQVLLTSAFVSKYVVTSAMRLGAQQLLHKPCSVDTVIGNLKRMCSGENETPAFLLWNGETNVETLVTSVLHEIGIPARIKGYQYVREAIILAVKDKDKDAILKCRYKEVADAFDTTAQRVERAIRGAVEVAWDRGDLDTLQRFFGYTVSNTKGKPTNTEFVSLIADKIRLWMKANARKAD